MTDQEIESLRRKVDRQVVCMGMGDEERFVNGSDIVLSRDTVTLLLGEIGRLRISLETSEKDRSDTVDFVGRLCKQIERLDEKIKQLKKLIP